MNKMVMLVTAMLVLSSAAQADYVVSSIHGKVVTGGQQLKLAQKLPGGAEVSSSDATAKVKLTDGDQILTMRGEFRVKLATSQEPVTVLEGRLRAKVGKTKPGFIFHMRTPVVLSGVRGTDYFLSFNPSLQESEIVCFESAVDFATTDGASKQIVKAGQWGGIGGRFGKVIAAPLNLPPAVMAKFNADTVVSD